MHTHTVSLIMSVHHFLGLRNKTYYLKRTTWLCTRCRGFTPHASTTRMMKEPPVWKIGASMWAFLGLYLCIFVCVCVWECVCTCVFKIMCAFECVCIRIALSRICISWFHDVYYNYNDNNITDTSSIHFFRCVLAVSVRPSVRRSIHQTHICQKKDFFFRCGISIRGSIRP